ncbi:MAG: AMP-dependent synthetase [Chloroflexi bacterium]|nr:MAG: AMP-dependent synthetase [Chloroflexota bacterium]
MERVALRTSRWPADGAGEVLETTVASILRDAAERAPDDLALVEGVADRTARRRWTFGRLLADSERAARALLGRFQPGERVAVWANNIPEWLLLEYGCALANLTLVTVNPAFRPRELAYVLGQSGAAGIFLVPEFRGNPMAASLDSVRPQLPALREALSFGDWDAFLDSGSPSQRLPEVTPDDIAQIQYTSGTTGFPKGARLHHRGITNNSRFYAARRGEAARGPAVNPMPLFHTAGSCMAATGCLQYLDAHVLVPYFDPGMVLEVVESEGGAVLGAVPTMLLAMMEHPDFAGRDLSRLRSVVSGGSTVPADLVRRVERVLGVDFAIVFGMTEASPVITQTWPDDTPEDKAGTIGQPLPRADVEIVDPGSGETVPCGEVGELRVRGYQVMRGYHEKPAETAEAIVDGRLRTGDLCSMDERGYCRVEGRLKDMIIRGGENIYPREIEELLFADPAVADVAVVGLPDDRWGERVAAFVRPAAGRRPTEADLVERCRDHLSPQKTPKVWVFVEEFPLTASGKIQKYVLRERFLKGELPA